MFKGYKTVVFNVVMGLAMMIRAFNPDAELPDADVVNASFDAVDAGLTALWTVGNLFLRALTSTQIFKKD